MRRGEEEGGEEEGGEEEGRAKVSPYSSEDGKTGVYDLIANERRVEERQNRVIPFSERYRSPIPTLQTLELARPDESP